ncbi:hypothetical protein PIB30_054434 [Stylosanthes scabra]|uniref:Uncharacterized protein n=1 Tax=Stylosanthes scabra TaxID=79078 RepID=A0ABU6QIQ1_9FABA|nr:hypothetical protein [Stylosanthes scabra]
MDLNQNQIQRKQILKMRDEQPPQHANVDAEQRTERRSKQRNDVNAAAATVTQHPQGSDPPQPHTVAAAVTEPPNSSDHPQPDAAPPQHVAAEINPVNPQEVSFFLICSTNKETTPIHEDVQVTPLDSGIEVVQATSAEEELISRELSNNITNLVVETQGEKAVINQQGSDPPQPHTTAAAVTEPPNSSDHPQLDAAPSQHVAAEINPVNPQEGRKEGVDDAMTAAEELMGGDLSNTNKETAPIQEDVQVTPQDCVIEVVEATSAEEQIIMQDLSKSDANVDAQNHEDVQVTPLDSGIEVVQATSAEEELISRELSNNIDPKEDMPTDKGSLLMVAEIALQHGKLGLPPSFKLCPEIDSQPEEEDQQPQKEDDQKLKGKEIEHQGTECKTPAPIIQDDRILMTRRLYK